MESLTPKVGPSDMLQSLLLYLSVHVCIDDLSLIMCMKMSVNESFISDCFLYESIFILSCVCRHCLNAILYRIIQMKYNKVNINTWQEIDI